jgi:hypothetical protein
MQSSMRIQIVCASKGVLAAVLASQMISASIPMLSMPWLASLNF